MISAFLFRLIRKKLCGILREHLTKEKENSVLSSDGYDLFLFFKYASSFLYFLCQLLIQEI
jgi:hypothetical protein